MWVFTTSGFVSAVFKDGALQVRARDRKSLASLSKETGAEIITTPLADYPYRLAITTDQFANWAERQAKSVDYKNFKSEVADTRGYGFAKALNKVWSAMHEVEDEKARVR
jgi:UDP-3-O-acyl-N-acetylglucosamine deacetylase